MVNQKQICSAMPCDAEATANLLWDDMLCYVVLWHVCVVLGNGMLCYSLVCCGTLCNAMYYYDMFGSVMPGGSMLCDVVICHDMTWYTMLCYAVF